MSKRLEHDNKLQQQIATSIGRRKDPEFMRFSKTLDSGYTYIGQLISHDITPATDQDRSSRVVTGALDLQSIYGDRQHYLLQHIGTDDLFFDKMGCFKIATDPCVDFCRNSHGTAAIPEQRNDDHVIIAQMHIFWQRLHNLLINNKFAKDALAAKKLVVLTFQTMVIEDYLFRLMDENVYQHIIGNNLDFLKPNKLWSDVFRFATFRFGHSTVRNSYSLRLAKDSPVPSRDLNTLFMGFRKPRKMTKDDQIDWRAFFCLAGCDQFEGVMPVDTRTSSFMNAIPNGEGIAIHIAAQNIRSELLANLPSGVAVAQKIAKQVPQSLEAVFSPLTNQALEEASFNHLGLNIEDLTIWLYTLLEAQLAEHPDKLGPVASCVNTQVIKQSIQKASFSIYQHGKYDFNQVTTRMGSWGEVLNGFAAQRSPGEAKLRMQNLVNYLITNE